MIRLPMIPVFAISRESEETWLGKLRGEQITYRTTFVLGFGIAGAVLFLGVLCAVLDIHLVHVAPILGMCALLSIGALTAHRLGLRIARDLATAFAILLFGMFLHPAIEHLSLRFGYSLVSAPLARADAAMGLNWLAYHNWVRSMAALREATLVTYNSFGIQMLLVPCLLAAVGATSRMLRFFAASAITLLAVDVIFMIWPADNAATFFRAGDPVPLSWSHDLVSYSGKLYRGAYHVLRCNRQPRRTSFISILSYCWRGDRRLGIAPDRSVLAGYDIGISLAAWRACMGRTLLCGYSCRPDCGCDRNCAR